MRSEFGWSWSEGSERPTPDARETMPMDRNEVPTTKGSVGGGVTSSMTIISMTKRAFIQQKATSAWRNCPLVGRVSLRDSHPTSERACINLDWIAKVLSSPTKRLLKVVSFGHGRTSANVTCLRSRWCLYYARRSVFTRPNRFGANPPEFDAFLVHQN